MVGKRRKLLMPRIKHVRRCTCGREAHLSRLNLFLSDRPADGKIPALIEQSEPLPGESRVVIQADEDWCAASLEQRKLDVHVLGCADLKGTPSLICACAFRYMSFSGGFPSCF